MSRFRRYAFSLASGYVFMVANAIFTLASVPLALGYLSTEEFGLWALTTQIGQYIALIDAGMAGSVSRILMDYKDNPAHPAYGSMIKTSMLVSVVQSLLILLIGVPLSPWLGAAMDVALPLRHSLTVLVIWQTVALAITFALRTPSLILAVHQRLDFVNYFQIGGLVVQYLVMWLGFHFGHGVCSVIWAQIAALILTSLVSGLLCWRLQLLPQAGGWGSSSWSAFKELFVFARDMFFFNLGMQLVNASQIILITRVLGLEAAAVWSICTRAFILANQIVQKILDFSCAPLAEMIVRQESQRLYLRFRSICILTTSLCVLCGLGFSACNNLFVFLWTKGQFEWPFINDILLSIWLLFSTLVRCHAGLTGLTKDFAFLRYSNFVQGAFFIGLSLIFFKYGGITAMLWVSIGTSIGVGYAYATWRTSGYLGVPWRETALDWLRQPLIFGLWMLPGSILIGWLAMSQRSLIAFVVCTVLLGGGGGSSCWPESAWICTLDKMWLNVCPTACGIGCSVVESYMQIKHDRHGWHGSHQLLDKTFWL